MSENSCNNGDDFEKSETDESDNPTGAAEKSEG